MRPFRHAEALADRGVGARQRRAAFRFGAGSDQLRERRGTGDRPPGGGRRRSGRHRAPAPDERQGGGGDGSGRPFPLPVPQDRTLRGPRRQAGLQGGPPLAHPQRRLGLPASDRARRSARSRRTSPSPAKRRCWRRPAARSRARSRPRRCGRAAHERPQFPRPRAAGARRVADQRGQHAALRRDLGRARQRDLGRQPAQLLQQLHRRRRCPPTTMPRGSAGSRWPSSPSSSSRSSPRAGRPSSAARWAATSTS